jgi:predicted phosphate transport protein (TIGR00153 family)
VRWFLPKTTDFITLFDQASANIVEAVCLFREIAGDLTTVKTGVERLKVLEHQGDRITHETLDKLNTTFITPFDREDIHTLTTRLDDILDAADNAGQRLIVYKVTEVPPRFLELADLLVASAKEVQTAVQALPDRKKLRSAIASCVEINRLENEADVVHRLALAELFDNAHDAIQVIKLKDLFSFLEDATDRCEDVANVIETIIIKGS